jgi:two-component system chemotaxis response regulator CheY
MFGAYKKWEKETNMKQKDFNDLRLLIVDDQPEMRALIKNMLMESGITQLFEASDGKEAMNFMDNALDFIDIVICDWNMPRLTGVEVLRQLRSFNPEMPFLMVTGRSDIASVAEAKSSGVSAYIRKPFSPAQLEAKLRIIKFRMDEKLIA